MEYISQIVLLLVALLGAFFKCVKEDSHGKIMYSRTGLPRPTRAGVVIAALLIASFLMSIAITWRDDEIQIAREREARGREVELRTELTEVKAQLNQVNAQLTQVNGMLKEVSKALLEARRPAAPASTRSITVSNSFSGAISFWLDGDRTDLQEQHSIALTVREGGSELWLYSCGWPPSQTSAGQGVGCRFLPYTVLPGESWDVVATSPAPRIILRRRP